MGRRRHLGGRKDQGTCARGGHAVHDQPLEFFARGVAFVIVGLRIGIFGAGHQRVDQVALRVILPRLDDPLEGLARELRARGEKAVDVVPRVGDVQRRPLEPVRQVRDGDVNERRAGRAEGRQRFFDDGVHFCGLGIGRVAEDLAQHAEPRPLQRSSVQPFGVGNVAGDRRGRRVGIRGVEAGDDLQQFGRIRDRAAHRAGRILKDDERRHAGAADQPGRDLQADQVVERSGQADGTAGVFAQADGAEVGGHRGTGSAARPARIVRRVIRVFRHARFRRIAEPGRGEVGHGGLGENDRAGSAELGDHRGVGVGHVAVQRNRTERGRNARGFRLILHDDRHAVQRALELPGGGERGVQPGGLVPRSGIHRHDRVERRPVAVVGVDAGQVGIEQSDAGDLARPQRRMNGGDGRFFEFEAHGGTPVFVCEGANFSRSTGFAKGPSPRISHDAEACRVVGRNHFLFRLSWTVSSAVITTTSPGPALTSPPSTT